MVKHLLVTIKALLLLSAVAVTQPLQATVPPEQTAWEMDQAQQLIGKTVETADAKAIGEISTLLVDSNDMVRAFVLEAGGILGMGEQRIVIDASKVTVSPEGDRVFVDLTEEQIKAAPAWKPGEPVPGYGVDVRPLLR